jgi:hypothetical protein
MQIYQIFTIRVVCAKNYKCDSIVSVLTTLEVLRHRV